VVHEPVESVWQHVMPPKKFCAHLVTPLPLQQVWAVHGWPSAVQVVVVVVLLLVLVLLLLVLLLLVLVLLELVVPLTQAAAVASDEAKGQPAPHACPAGQQVREAPLPHGVVPAGHPHSPADLSWQATPLLQQLVPQGVVPFGQQHDVAGSVHVPPFGQHPCPQAWLPAGQVTAPLRNGRRSVAAVAAAAVAPMSFSAPRRDVGRAMLRDRSSNRSFTSPPQPAVRSPTSFGAQSPTRSGSAPVTNSSTRVRPSPGQLTTR